MSVVPEKDTTKTTSTFSIQEEFPPVQYDQWRSLVEDSLHGAPFEKKLVTHTYEGIDLQPVYTLADRISSGDYSGFPGSTPFIRGATAEGSSSQGWDLRQEYSAPDLTACNEAILKDLNGGATSLLLILDQASRNGLNPDNPDAEENVGHEGLMVYHLDQLDALLNDVDLAKVAIAVDAGTAFLPASALLSALWQRRDVLPEEARGAFNADPLAHFASQGQLPLDLKSALNQLADLAVWTAENYPRVTAVSVNTAAYHHAGATAAQDLAFALGTATEYLRAMTSANLNIDAAAKQILFRISLGTHHFLSIAKLRAGRKLWARVVESCGGTAAAMHVHSRLSNRVLTKNDPYVNLLRNTVGVFAAGIGGAEVITSVPYNQSLGQPDDFSRRVARNTGLVLQEEAHLHRVIDPAGGSWFLESLTAQLAEKAWEIFQQIEQQGGMSQALQSGWIADQIDTAYAPRTKDIATRKEGITGVSEFPNIDEQQTASPPPDLASLRKSAQKDLEERLNSPNSLASIRSSAEKTSAVIQAAAEGATIGQLAEALDFHQTTTETTPLEPRSFAQPYEELREACDNWLDMHGNRPRVFLANMGPIAHHTARATYSKSFFEAGGFEVTTNEGFADADSAAEAFTASRAGIAVICSSDKLYPDFVPKVAQQLKAAGARTVLLAGRPGSNEEAWRTAGVDRFIYISCNVLATLRELLEEEGVLAQ